MIILSLKLISFILRKFTSHSATALPGRVVEKYFPAKKTKILSKIKKTIFITGTNGKTTTTKMLTYLLDQEHIKYINNKSGSNMTRGILSMVINNMDAFSGKLDKELAILEIEEATAPKLAELLKPDLIIVTNVFRDQLDAYGEITKTVSYIEETIKLSDNPDLIINGDDGNVNHLGKFTNGNTFVIKIHDKFHDLIKYETPMLRDTHDVAKASEDGINKQQHEEINIKNLSIREQVKKQNEQQVKQEKNKKEINDKKVTKIQDAVKPPEQILEISSLKLLSDDLNFKYDVKYNKKLYRNINVKVPGFHNSFNSLAAILAFGKLKDNQINVPVLLSKYASSFKTFIPAFGRGEIIRYKNTLFQIFLVKNPAGMNLNLRTLEYVYKREALLLILNDNIADGRDVSWIWDSDFSILKNLEFANIYLTGTRRFDLAIRLKYQGIHYNEIYSTVRQAVKEIANKEHPKVFVLPTYTSMLELRRELAKVTNVEKM